MQTQNMLDYIAISTLESASTWSRDLDLDCSGKLREWMDENYLVVTAIVLGVVKPYGCVTEPPQNYCVALTSVVVYKI